VDLLGVMAGDDGQANDRILVHPHEAAGLADATVLLKMLQHRDGFVLGEFAAIKGRALAFGEALLTGAAGQNPGAFAGAVAETDPEIVQAPAAIVIAVEVLAAEGFQVVHSLAGLPWGNEKVVSQLESPYKAAGNTASLVGHYRIFEGGNIMPVNFLIGQDRDSEVSQFDESAEHGSRLPFEAVQ
jgi:hypothetical protein